MRGRSRRGLARASKWPAVAEGNPGTGCTVPLYAGRHRRHARASLAEATADPVHPHTVRTGTSSGRSLPPRSGQADLQALHGPGDRRPGAPHWGPGGTPQADRPGPVKVRARAGLRRQGLVFPQGSAPPAGEAYGRPQGSRAQEGAVAPEGVVVQPMDAGPAGRDARGWPGHSTGALRGRGATTMQPTGGGLSTGPRRGDVECGCPPAESGDRVGPG